MTTIIKDVLKALGTKLAEVIIALAKVATAVVGFLEHRREDKKEEQKKEEQAQKESKIDDVCDNGSIQDLVDL